MNNYTIYCTEEQAKKVYKLGAPLAEHPFEPSIIKANERLFGGLTCISERYYIIPTAEQMIGWLEEQGLSFHIMQPYNNKTDFWLFIIRPSFEKGTNFSSRKEATIAAIDYLVVNDLIK